MAGQVAEPMMDADQEPLHEAVSACEGPDGIDEVRLLDGRVRLRQGRKGYRAGMDAALLAAALGPAAGIRVLEAGCGAGGGLLQAAMRWPDAHFTGLERDPAALALAQENIALNGLEGRVATLPGDVGGGFTSLGPAEQGLAPFDAAFANPPFFDDAGALRAPLPERRGAWIADHGLAAWVRFLIDAVRDRGRVMIIHRADRLGDMLAALAPRAGSVVIRPVSPFAEAPAKRVLVQAIRGGRAPLVLLPPLVLHDRSGPKHTVEADAILRGHAPLSWDQS